MLEAELSLAATLLRSSRLHLTLPPFLTTTDIIGPSLPETVLMGRSSVRMLTSVGASGPDGASISINLTL
ncbi:hypothetical protein J1614_011198 [Plenodomus biglobosus]|nr:hypothetical protein J1614_011198 [Plenodomus biglobosus]